MSAPGIDALASGQREELEQALARIRALYPSFRVESLVVKLRQGDERAGFEVLAPGVSLGRG